MADKYAAGFRSTPRHFAEHGNTVTEVHSWNGAAAIADKVYLGIIPAGTRVTSFRLINDAVAGGTLTVGYEPVDAAEGPAAVADYWFPAGTSIATAGIADSKAKPATFERDVAVVAVVAGAALTAGKDVMCVSQGQMRGFR